MGSFVCIMPSILQQLSQDIVPNIIGGLIIESIIHGAVDLAFDYSQRLGVICIALVLYQIFIFIDTALQKKPSPQVRKRVLATILGMEVGFVVWWTRSK